jgi:hypothetical protein
MVRWAALKAEVWRKTSHSQQMQECSRHGDAQCTMETELRKDLWAPHHSLDQKYPCIRKVTSSWLAFPSHANKNGWF